MIGFSITYLLVSCYLVLSSIVSGSALTNGKIYAESMFNHYFYLICYEKDEKFIS